MPPGAVGFLDIGPLDAGTPSVDQPSAVRLRFSRLTRTFCSRSLLRSRTLMVIRVTRREMGSEWLGQLERFRDSRLVVAQRLEEDRHRVWGLADVPVTKANSRPGTAAITSRGGPFGPAPTVRPPQAGPTTGAVAPTSQLPPMFSGLHSPARVTSLTKVHS